MSRFTGYRRPALDFDARIQPQRPSGLLVFAVVAFLIVIVGLYLVKGVG